MARSGDLYDVLGVPRDASPQDVKKAFRGKARELHPDVAGNDPAKAAAFQRVREAYEVLSDPAERARYDRRGQPRSGGPFYGSMWNRGTVNVGAAPAGGAASGARSAGNDLDLEDIFNDFSGVGDFGFAAGGGAGASGRFKGAGGGGFSGARSAASGGRAEGAPRTTGSGTTAGGSRGRQEGGRRVHGTPSSDGRGSDSSEFAGFGSETAGAPRQGGRSADGVSGERAGARANESSHGRGAGSASASRGGRRVAEPGRDVTVPVDVPHHVARAGGSVTVTYVRLRRADDGHTLYRYDELHDLKVPPGTRPGDTLRVEKLGDAGVEGGPYGDLVVEVRIGGLRGAGGGDAEAGERRAERAWGEPERAFADRASWGGAPPRNAPPGGRTPLDPPPGSGAAPGAAGDPSDRRDAGAPPEAGGAPDDAVGAEPGGPFRRRPPEGARSSAWSPGGWSRRDDPTAPGARPADASRREPGRMRMPGQEPATTADGAVRVDVGLVTALLGGRVRVPTPTGEVRVQVPAGTSSGTRMRLRGRGPAGPDGAATDLVAELRIVVPKNLDDESRALIERFAALNPETDTDAP